MKIILLISLIAVSYLNAELSDKETERVVKETKSGIICPDTKKEICGKKDDKIITYDNECKLEKSGAIKLYNGPCKIIKIEEPSKIEMKNMSVDEVTRKEIFNVKKMKHVNELSKKEVKELKEEKLLKEQQEKEQDLREKHHNKELQDLKSLINDNEL